MPPGPHFSLKSLTNVIAFTLACQSYIGLAEENVEFNTQFLESQEGASYDISRFSRKGYVLPGSYDLQVFINNSALPDEHTIMWYAADDSSKNSFACLSPQLVSLLGIQPALTEKFIWIKDGACLKPGQLDGMEIEADLSHSALNITLPQAYLEYTDKNWDPPSRWDNGVSGILFDYNVNADHEHRMDGSGNEHDISGNGTVGANIGAWRLRADWQGNYQRLDDQTYQQWNWNRYYAYRALPSLSAQLTLGEDYLQSDIFDSFNYAGASIRTDDQMLPPNLRGYAPDIIGVARSVAKVIVSQQNRVLYEKQVPAGPFHIQDISQSTTGDLHVRVEEQDGNVQEYDVTTASIPFLTRLDQVRYKAAVGRPQSWDLHMEGSPFGVGEASWGIANGWSLYGGMIGEQDYQALALGVGRDLAILGALAVDVTNSRTHLTEDTGYGTGTLQGNSFRISYAKNFDELHSRLSFAGYRFSEEKFMTMNESLDARNGENIRAGHDKEMFTMSYNQNFIGPGLNMYFNWTQRTYWDRQDQNNYNVMVSKYFDISRIRNISLSLNAFRNEFDNEKDDGLYLSLSVPLGDNRTLSYSGSFDDNTTSNRVGYYEQLDNHNNYQVNVGQSEHATSVDGYYRHTGSYADVDMNASYVDGDYSSVGLSLTGGATLTTQGGALHRTSIPGGTRLLVDTSGVPDIPVGGYSDPVYTNRFGKAIISDVNDYNRNDIRIDIDHLPENAEALRSIAQATLTSGAIGYRQFDVISGVKAMAVLRMSNGSHPPLGAEVKNHRQQQVGLVDENGSVYLVGVNPGEKMQVSWNGDDHCEIALPTPLPNDLFNGLFLPCRNDKPLGPNTPVQTIPAIQQQTNRLQRPPTPENISGIPALVTSSGKAL